MARFFTPAATPTREFALLPPFPLTLPTARGFRDGSSALRGGIRSPLFALFFHARRGKQKIRLFNISLQQDLVLDNEMFRRILLGRMGKIGRIGFFNLAFRIYHL